jgi:hypothetical protein
VTPGPGIEDNGNPKIRFAASVESDNRAMPGKSPRFADSASRFYAFIYVLTLRTTVAAVTCSQRDAL